MIKDTLFDRQKRVLQDYFQTYHTDIWRYSNWGENERSEFWDHKKGVTGFHTSLDMEEKETQVTKLHNLLSFQDPRISYVSTPPSY